MTYNQLFQRTFVTGRYTAISLLVASLLLWLLGLFSGANDGGSLRESIIYGFSVSQNWLGSLLALPIYLLIAYILNSLVILESRTSWLAFLFLYLLSMNFFLHGNFSLAISLLLFILSITILSSCIDYDGVQRRIYAIFLFFALSAIFFPQLIYLLPIFFLYLYISKIFKFRNLLAALLGIATPLWLLFGTAYIYPQLKAFTTPLLSRVTGLFVMKTALSLTVAQLLFMSIEVLLLIHSVWLLIATSNPAKPIMRRMLSLFIITNAYLWILSFFSVNNFNMFFVWRLPGVALMLAYVATVKITKLSNIYFVILNILLLIVAFLGLWN